MRKPKFIRFFHGLFLSGKAVALYESAQPGSYLACAETSGGKVLGRRIVTQEWLDSLPGNELGRVANAIEDLTHGRVKFD